MKNISYEVKDGIAVIKFNRPEKLNSLTLQMYEDLGEAFKKAQADNQVAACILTGAGEKAFCVGADLTESIPYLGQGHYIDEWDPAHLKHVDMYKPVICAVNGHCMGGGFEIMLASDIRVASSEATFALPEVSLGIVPAGGTLARLARQIPYIRAMELILMGEKISAKTALDYGVLNHVVAPKDVMDKAMEIAKKFCTLSTTAVQTAKESVLKLREIPLEQAFETEALLGYKAFTSEDAKEGLAAFYDKRKPEFPSRKW
ncbi:MAG: enoyl-CoA hydratase/isomerase family protein [Emergencia sp.]|jgi:enoyl-CoA hydratase/carnithine racemase|uniref:enoyl-CoA hydratase/isomerase family protein n=1 Tax=Emergencia sp. 1XD21-10 TaxID=2304569 RepID=UPI00137B1197|nr:enoyl-CoA hydratase/isomerase family protein [Emergencia sp. 1XD21-10]MCI9476289.1 enoyl-CoA hydratase/isomerase family protein [Emergencia sp.]NCE99104.1 enoyl-CoA hydratase/isomerase family protein [Emergencia sp. 1XD21-10]